MQLVSHILFCGVWRIAGSALITPPCQDKLEKPFRVLYSEGLEILRCMFTASCVHFRDQIHHILFTVSNFFGSFVQQFRGLVLFQPDL